MDAHPQSRKARRRSYSATINNQRHVPAARCAANVVSSASNRSVANPKKSVAATTESSAMDDEAVEELEEVIRRS